MVVLDHLARCVAGFEKAFSPGVFVEAESSGVPTDDALAEDATWEETKPLLLQRNQVALADLGDRRYLLQRDAAGQPLHAQVFSKVSH